MNYIKQLEEQGYCIIPNVLEKHQVSWYLDAVKSIYEKTKDKICQETPYLNRTSPNVYNLQNKSKVFIDLITENKQIEEILIHFLNDKWYKQIPANKPNYILRHCGARSSNEALPLHIDSFIPYIGGEVIAMQVAFMLEDSTIERGCTTVIPKTHRTGLYAQNDTEREIVEVEAKAGDVLIWDSRLWHGTTKNTTESTRWAIISTFTRWFVKQMFNIPQGLPENIKEQLSPKQKSILGFSSVPYESEYFGIEMKKGYEEK